MVRINAGEPRRAVLQEKLSLVLRKIEAVLGRSQNSVRLSRSSPQAVMTYQKLSSDGGAKGVGLCYYCGTLL